jgi:GMP reductase
MEDTLLDFSDVLIKPSLSFLESRNDVNLKREFEYTHGEYVMENIPVIAANMDTVGTMDVFNVLHKHKIMTFFHKFITNEEFLKNKKLLESNQDYFAITIGMGSRELDRLKELSEKMTFKGICVDVANGYMDRFVSFCSEVREAFPDHVIFAGNVVCAMMTRRLILDGGVDVVKVGIGGGSACTTRIKTGVGVPQLSAVQDCAEAAHEIGAHIISDGGITCPGDVAKAFGAGADFVMIGGQFSGHDQNPGEIIEEDGEKYKLFYGMSSEHAMKKNYNGVNNYRTSEGRCLRVRYKGDINETVSDFLGGLRSACTYIGCENLEEMSDFTKFVRVGKQFNNSLVH